MSSQNALPPPPAEAAAHSRALAAHIASVIAAGGGWIPFSRYMELALYAPGLGYYAAGARKFGAEGDFVTAPEISPMFGECIARQAQQVLDAVGGEILELGPGAGTLAADIHAALRANGARARYRLLEVSPDLRERQREKLAQRFPGELDRFEWLDTLPASFRGIVVANEVLDVVPFAIVRRVGERLFERGVVVRDAGFAWDERPLPDGALGRRAHDVFPPGDYEYESEISLAAEGLVRTVASSLEAGVALFIDYGFAEHEYYHPQRSMGTMRCHYRHRFHGDPFFMPGLQDITAHVDFSALARSAADGGLDVLGYATQAQFLVNCGITDVLAQANVENALRYAPIAAEAQKLLSPVEMGQLFKVLALGRGVKQPLAGFSQGDRSHTL
jgi:SAM-dependent MidA family methyltransferase